LPVRRGFASISKWRLGVSGVEALTDFRNFEELVSQFAGDIQAALLVKIGASEMSKMSGDSARFNKIKTRRNVHRARMRALRAEIAARKRLPGSEAEGLKT
jgi:hypothetical protein